MTEARKRELQAELDNMTVHRETLVGWDENTPPNETGWMGRKYPAQ